MATSKTVKLTRLTTECNVRCERANWFTNFIIRIEGTQLIVASGVIGGKWNSYQALAEFKKQPARFHVVQKNLDIAKAAGLL